MGWKKLLCALCALVGVVGCAACGEKENLSLWLSSQSESLAVGQSVTIEAVAEGLSGEIVWGTDQETLVSLNPSGSSVTVTALAEGTAVVYAACEEDGTQYRAECTVTVSPAPEAKLSFLMPTLVLRRNVSATVRAFAEESLSGDVIWESSDVSVGTVESQGLIAVVTAVSGGVCTITVTYGGESASFTLIVGI